MAIGYPNGKKRKVQTKDSVPEKNKMTNYGKRGMSLEEDLNETNAFYLAHERAVIHKKPTPVQIVRVDYPKRSNATIKEAYFKQPSTTDYNGVYRGKYLDFEAKETKNKTSFPLSNFHPHQMEHMKQILKQDGFAFVITSFSSLGVVYLTRFDRFLPFWERMESGGRKSVTLEELQAHSKQIPYGLNPRLDYLSIIDTFF
ncbi:Holliday junction resolvase RecU [Listeria fleischmannii]|jgi:recombination protein U|uniref:Holliday junction resolvase RecU n=1 Tax=Listeria fleischmannii TaxID=1069827 RepID=A0A841YHR7_9LIST|nr:Holliday junction resolvase RecU [Listeria fleischmannii]EIA20239.1 Holliday junction-specific endonuclease [Listeria fleischmannii subsp. coloradonensis]MBC1399618.1 Holliday junction resolvase RecU [Listeria fleischmannii]MBC1418504.1 Holliday junction resolvase RecU [Listeria fleischmannii]MBC1427869.1 Holliday junction resolvase RecU [Listeria fleischmannii]STY35501.1 Holliday junction resolvase recU [Listeria fleischmannii subsp. coloradonensis]